MDDASLVPASFHYMVALPSVWLGNKVVKGFMVHTSHGYSAIFALRHRMLTFVQNLEYYMMFEVIEQNWLNFRSSMGTVSC